MHIEQEELFIVRLVDSLKHPKAKESETTSLPKTNKLAFIFTRTRHFEHANKMMPIPKIVVIGRLQSSFHYQLNLQLSTSEEAHDHVCGEYKSEWKEQCAG
jgi:hypothetical protein